MIVVTGASTGIGRAVAECLSARGCEVLAGVRTEADADNVRGPGVTPVLVDVTDAAQVQRLRDAVGDRPLAGLVNNAGVSVSGPLEFLELDELRRQFEVNLFGQVAVTQALLEALRRARGRVVNIGSVGARTPLPFLAPYAASKAALWAVGETLRGELRPWGIHVAVIEPGAIATEIWRKGAAQAASVVDGLPPRGRELYGDRLRHVEEIVRTVSSGALPPEAVAEQVEHALFSRRPRDRYLLGREARAQVLARRLLGWRRYDAVVARRMKS